LVAFLFSRQVPCQGLREDAKRGQGHTAMQLGLGPAGPAQDRKATGRLPGTPEVKRQQQGHDGAIAPVCGQYKNGLCRFLGFPKTHETNH
jgi:hypothetical protein